AGDREPRLHPADRRDRAQRRRSGVGPEPGGPGSLSRRGLTRRAIVADLQPVRPPRSPFSGHGALIGSIVVIGVLLAAVKPWGGTGGPPAATLFPSAAVAPSIEAPDGSDGAVATPSEFDLR